MGTRLEFLAVTVGTVLIAHIAQAADTPRNVILFVPDGLRALAVTPETAPTMAAVRDQGVNFANPHSLFPTFTMPNSSGMSTGHELGDTGTFSNTIFTGYPVPQAGGSVTPFIENDAVLGDIDEHFAGNFVDEESIVKAARGTELQYRAHRQARPDADLRPHRAHRRTYDRGRRCDRQRQRNPAVAGHEGRTHGGAACR